jgi:hypothetical protein
VFRIFFLKNIVLGIYYIGTHKEIWEGFFTLFGTKSWTAAAAKKKLSIWITSLCILVMYWHDFKCFNTKKSNKLAVLQPHNGCANERIVDMESTWHPERAHYRTKPTKSDAANLPGDNSDDNPNICFHKENLTHTGQPTGMRWCNKRATSACRGNHVISTDYKHRKCIVWLKDEKNTLKNLFINKNQIEIRDNLSSIKCVQQ